MSLVASTWARYGRGAVWPVTMRHEADLLIILDVPRGTNVLVVLTLVVQVTWTAHRGHNRWKHGKYLAKI